MKLRKCPDCKNWVNPASECCPICGCNPRMRLLRRVLVLGVLVLLIGWWLHSHFMP